MSRARQPIKRPPTGAALEALAGIASLRVELEEVRDRLDALYSLAVQKYLEAQEKGATVDEIAAAAGMSRQGIKYNLAQERKRQGALA